RHGEGERRGEGEAVVVRHGRACPGHPRLKLLLPHTKKGMDARHKAGHDGLHPPLEGEGGGPSKRSADGKPGWGDLRRKRSSPHPDASLTPFAQRRPSPLQGRVRTIT